MYPEIAEYMSRFNKYKQIGPTDIDMLFTDPYTLPIDRPNLPTTVLRSLITPALKIKTRNEHVLELIKASEDDQQEAIMECLRSARPLDVKVLSTIYSATPRGILTELIRKFESSRSVYELLILRHHRRGANRILRRVVIAEVTLQKWRYDRLVGKHSTVDYDFNHMMSPQCPAEIAHNIRAKAWGREVVGITMPPLQHQVIYVAATQYHDDMWINNNHFEYKILPITDSISMPQYEHYSTGNHKPFLGYTTSAGTTEPTVHFIESDVILNKLKNLIDIVSWADRTITDDEGIVTTSNTRDVVKVILSMYTDIPLEKLAPFAGARSSGTVQHHCRAPSYRESIVPNVLSNIYTRVVGNSYAHYSLRSSSSHFTINFLHVYCHSVWITTMELEFSPKITTPDVIWGVTTPCSHCNKAITEVPLIFNTKFLKGVSLHALHACKLNEVSFQVLTESVNEFIGEKPVNPMEVGDLSIEDATYVLIQEMVYESWHIRVSIHERYTSTHLDEAGRTLLARMIPRKVFQKVNPRLLSRCSLTSIINYLHSFILTSLNEHKPMAGSDEILTWIQVSPGEELPWFPIVNACHLSGVLFHVVRVLGSEANVSIPAVHASPVSASKFIGRAVWISLDTKPRIPRLIIVSNYEVGTLSRHIMYYTGGVYWRCLFSSYIQPWMQGGIKDYEYGSILCKLCAAALLCALYYNRYVERLNELIVRIRETQGYRVEFWLVPDIEPDELVAMYDDISDNFGDLQNLMVSKIQNLIRRRSPSLYTSAIDYLLSGPDQTYEILLENKVDTVYEIQFTTLSYCFNTIRGNTSYHSRDEDVNLIQNVLDSQNYHVSRTGILTHEIPTWSTPNFKLKLLNQLPLTHSLTDYRILPEMEGSLLISPRHCLQSIGKYNYSSSIAVELLRTLGLNNINSIPAGSAVCCLADGLGGFCSAIDEYMKDGIIVFHTKPDTDNLDVYPEALIEKGTINNSILLEHIRQGYVDLSFYAVLERIESEKAVFPLVTCDIDYIMDPRKIRSILWNILKFFMRNTTPNGILIIPLPLNTGKLAHEFITLVSYYVREGWVIMPSASTNFRKAYMVIRGKSRVFKDDNTMWPYHTSDINTSRLNKFVDILKKEYEDNLLPGYNFSINRMFSVRYNRSNVVALGILGIRQLSILMLTPISEDQIEGIETRMVPIELVRRIENDIRLIKTGELEREYLRNTDVIFDANTRAHRTRIIQNLFRLEGVKYILSLWSVGNKDLRFTRLNLRDYYLSVLDTYHRRDRYLPINEDHFTSGFYRGGSKCSYYHAMTLGINTGLRIIGYLLIRIKD